jgi:hypothetical protein
MTDVYVAYAREDRDRLRLITEMLRFEGWDLWMDPFDLSDEPSPAAELKLASARVILAFWSDSSRTSEVVRSEAATGLYKNKLVQLRVEGGAPPRPFDQVESLDFAHWRGDIDDPAWRRLIASLKQHAGEPAGTRALPNTTRKVMAPPPSMPSMAQPSLSQPSQNRPPPALTPPTRPHQVFPPLQPAAPQAVAPPPPVFQAPPPPPIYQMPPAPPPVYQMPPPQPPAYQPLPPQPVYQAPPPPPVFQPQPQPPAPPPTFQLAQQARMPVYDLPPAPPPLPPLIQPAEPSERRWRQPASELDFAEPRAGTGRSGGSIAYAETKGGGGMAWGPVAAAGVLIVSGLGLWFGDPFGWRSGAGPGESEPVAMAARTVSDAPVANAEPMTAAFEDSDESNESWTRVNRKSAEALRDHVGEYPRASTAEQARSLLRVMDAQAWVTAVTADNDAAYQAYLKRFPAEGVMPGAMAVAARDRLASLGSERLQAIEEIQRGLAALELYSGPVDGKGGGTTAQAVTKFASANRRTAPSLSTGSPRELRAFAESVRRAGSRDVASAEVAAASQADLMRVAQAQALAASLAAAPIATPDNADALALGQQQRLAEAQAWTAADQAGTAAAFQAYLAAWPNGPNAAAAKAALTKANRPAPYSLDLLSADVRNVVDAARKSAATANQKAAAARQAATAADGLVNAGTITAANGDRFVAQIARGAPNGVGLRVRGSGANSGDRYRGELRNGLSVGVGVYEFADNPGNSGSRAARYEGEYAADAASGYGVFAWRSGDSFAGNNAGGGGQARGVLTYENGQRYEGDMSNGQRDGVGVFWGSDGAVMQAGRWSKDALAEPMKAPAAQQ